MSEITMFLCGPKKGCKHDYSGWEDLKDEHGNVNGGTAICAKCGASAFAESMWDDGFDSLTAASSPSISQSNQGETK